MFPTLIFGLIGVAAALRCAVRADGRMFGFLSTLATAVLFFSLSGFTTGIVATGNYVVGHELRGEELGATLVAGVQESTNNLALGFTLVGLIHLLLAVGKRRYDAQKTLA
jgi:hypothetical protein